MSIQIVNSGGRTQTRVTLPAKSVNIRIVTYLTMQHQETRIKVYWKKRCQRRKGEEMPRGKKDDIDDEAMVSIKQLLQIKHCDTLFILLPHLISKRVSACHIVNSQQVVIIIYPTRCILILIPLFYRGENGGFESLAIVLDRKT